MSLTPEWLTFGIMLVIQVAAAGALVSRINYITKDHSREIEALRKWRHDFGQKEMVYDDHGERIEKLEERVTDLERGNHGRR